MAKIGLFLSGNESNDPIGFDCLDLDQGSQPSELSSMAEVEQGKSYY